MPQQLAGLALLAAAGPAAAVGADEADGVAAQPALHHVFQPHKGAATDEQDLAGIDLNAVLVGVFASTLGRHIGHRALQHLQ